MSHPTPIDATEPSTNHDTTNSTSDHQSSTTDLPCPPEGGSYETYEALEDYVKDFARQNHYDLSCLDSIPTSTTWKCIKGPNRKQIGLKKANPDLNIPTCRFAIIGSWDSKSETWFLKIKNAKHDHGPILDLKPSKPRKAPSTKPRKQRCDSKKQLIPKQTNRTHLTQDDEYEALIIKLDHIEPMTRKTLIKRFLHDCKPAEELVDSMKTSNDEVVKEKGENRAIRSCTPADSEPEEDRVKTPTPNTTCEEGHAASKDASTSAPPGNNKRVKPPTQPPPESPLTSQSENESQAGSRAEKARQTNSIQLPIRKSKRVNSRGNENIQEEPNVKKRKQTEASKADQQLRPQQKKKDKRVDPFSLQSIVATAQKTKQIEQEKQEEQLLNASPEERALIKWHFIETLPRIIYPFIKMATNVEPSGLCAFASVAFSLGRTEEDRVAIRAEMAAEVRRNYEWYRVHLPKLSQSGTTVTEMLSILEYPKSTASYKYWYPMPGGCCVIANTFKRPVIFYSNALPNALTTPPFLSSPQDNTKPIILTIIKNTHCISLEMDMLPSLPIPYIHHEWRHFRSPEARGWDSIYAGNIQVYKDWRKRSKSIRGPSDETQEIFDEE